MKKNTLFSPLFDFLERKDFVTLGSTLFFQVLTAFFEIATFFFFFSSLEVIAQEKGTFETFLLMLFLALCMQILKSFSLLVASVIKIRFIGHWREKISASFRSQILHFSFPFLSHYKVGGLTSIFKIPFESLSIYSDALFIFTQGILISLALLLGLFFLSPLFTLVVFLLVILGLSLQRKIRQAIQKNASLYADYVTELAEYFSQIVSGMRVITTFHLFSHVEKNMKKQTRKVTSAIYKLLLNINIQTQLTEIFLMFLIVFSALFGYLLFRKYEKEGIFLLITYLAILVRLSRQISFIISSYADMKGQMGELGKLLQFLDKEDKEYAQEGRIVLSPFSTAVHFDKVFHAYIPGKTILHEISFTLQKGESLGIVGKSGAGKSTLIDLLLRLYDPYAGKIFVDGIPLIEVNIGSWRRQLAVVSQDTYIFNESIAYNLCMGEDISLDAMKHAAKIAGCHDFIEPLPQGYETLLGERGYRLSGGERQRISLARALLRDSEILILDEATSSLDSPTESFILQSLKKFYGKKTLLLIAHRLSTLHFCDRIIVFDQGKIVEEGSHRELLQEKGLYFQMWSQQVDSANSLVFSS